MATVEGNRSGDTSSNRRLDCLYFSEREYTWERYEPNYFPFNYEKNIGYPGLFKIGLAEGKLWNRTYQTPL